MIDRWYEIYIVCFTKKLIGIVTDGDLRRALLNDNFSLKRIINYDPITMPYGSSQDKILKKLKTIYRNNMPLVDKNNKLVEVVSLENINFNVKPNWVCIMAGGLGKRMGELTKAIPKPMLTLGTKPILEHIINHFSSQGFKKFLISTGYKASIIKDFFKNGKEWGVHIEYITEKERMGTGGSLSLLNKKFDNPIIIANGDIITSLNVQKVINFHKKENAHATMCIRKKTFTIPFGLVDFDKKNNFKSINEKPNLEYYINCGIYILNPEILKIVPKSHFDLPLLFSKSKKNKIKSKVFEITDKWVDLGYPQEYHKLNDKLD